MAKTEWKPNEKQVLFMETLKGSKEPMTLAEVSKVAGVDIKSGSINCLISKGLVKTTEKEVVITKTEVRKVYSLVENDQAIKPNRSKEISEINHLKRY